MPVVPRAEHLAELRPVEERRRRRVRGDEPLAIVLHERQEIGLLLVVERHVPMPQEEDRVDVVQARAAAGRLAGRHQRLFATMFESVRM